MPPYADKAIQVTVRGLVQGVGFRWSTRRMAHQTGVAGWVRNLADGAVGVWVQGPAAAVEDMRRFLEQGPPGAVVSSVGVTEVEPDPALTGFELRY